MFKHLRGRAPGGLVFLSGLVFLPTAGWADGLTVEITSPAPNAILRGPSCAVWFKVNSTVCNHGIKECKLEVTNSYFLQGCKKAIHDPPAPMEHTDTLAFSPIEEVKEGTQTITVTATCSHDPPHTGSASLTVKIDVDLLYRIERTGEADSFLVKCWNGSGWWPHPFNYSWACGTRGIPHDNNQGLPCSHTPHTYCTNGDHPPRTGTTPSTADEITSNALAAGSQHVWNHQTPGDPSDDVTYWVNSSGSVMGHWKTPLPNKTAPCGCLRQSLRIHGGRSTNPDVGMQHNQGLAPTWGCIRMLNGCPHHVDDNLELQSKKHNYWRNLGHRIYIYVPQ